MSCSEDSVREFQETAVERCAEHELLRQQRTHLERLLYRKKYLCKELQLLYLQIDKTRNYQEFLDVLTHSRPLLREIFTMESQQRAVQAGNLRAPDIDWVDKFGINLEDYVVDNDRLLSLYNEGLL
ncbi:Ahc2p KNAG_0I02740 [Huiozyma naganishii CBS 8797]|uniref:Uncharacterized protein n=1 Tax=Huiozyma naganishii (strain ATCC MYA-139 / BCRC 22969 / CBS 8797 / KCTC 17520 / NBRC 10181 / NCYC 3082 / Yp74L-3) TaxID=1071383 RepID=J7S9E7_HUIN7|nr:hypothetical protein KNAG_0I02740 [Kazachstania naganishii CBS 8797]CCK72059.1 hypothetical protein KNAG_0I02740 [Kazachstania naganishii CBS 8797]